MARRRKADISPGSDADLRVLLGRPEYVEGIARCACLVSKRHFWMYDGDSSVWIRGRFIGSHMSGCAGCNLPHADIVSGRREEGGGSAVGVGGEVE